MCAQTTKFTSTDGAVFLYITSDGNLVLYNTANFNKYGSSSAGATIWQSNTGGHSGSQPFQLTMQNVRDSLSAHSLFDCWTECAMHPPGHVPAFGRLQASQLPG